MDTQSTRLRRERLVNVAIGVAAFSILGVFVSVVVRGLRSDPAAAGDAIAAEPISLGVQAALMGVVVVATAVTFWLAARTRRGTDHATGASRRNDS